MRISTRWWWIIIVFAIFTTILAYFILNKLPTKYSVSTKIFVSTSTSSAIANVYNDAPYTDRAVKTIMVLLSSRPVLESLSSASGINTEDLNKVITSRYITGTQLIEIEIVTDDPNQAVNLGAAIPTTLETFLDSIQKDTDAKDRIKISVAEPVGQAEVLPKFNTEKGTIIFILGLFLAYLILLLIDYFDKSIKNEKDLEQFDLKHLGNFGLLKNVHKDFKAIFDKQNSPAAETIREVRTNIEYLKEKNKLATIAITSANSQEGKTLFIASLALMLGESGKKVVIVDSDLRSPSIHKLLKINNEKGMSDFLKDKAKIEDIIKKTVFDNLWLIPAGNIMPNASELLSDTKIEKLKKWLVKHVDYIIFDTPPIGVISDAANIARFTDGAIIVIEKDRTNEEDLRKVIRALKNVGAKILGAVITKVKAKKSYKNKLY